MRQFGGIVGLSLACAGALVALAMLPPTARGEDARRPAAELRLVWVDLRGVSPAQLEAAATRIQSLLAPAGVRISARRAVPGVGDDIEGIRVVLMRSLARTRRPPESVAGVAGVAGQWPPTVWVCPEVVAANLRLDTERAHLWTLLQRRDFANGLGAVVVHELAHTLFGASHQPRGLEAAQLGVDDLVDPRLALAPGLLAAFQTAALALANGRGLSPVPPTEPSAYALIRHQRRLGEGATRTTRSPDALVSAAERR
jgi:hypothetical protein